MKVLLTVEPGPVGPVAVRSKMLNIGRRIPRPERVKACYDIVAAAEPDKSDATEWTFAKEIVLLDAMIQKQPRADVEVQAVQIGPAVFVSNPAEYFVEYGLGDQAGEPVPVHVPGRAGQRLRRLRADRRSPRPARRRLRDPADLLQQPRTDGRHADHERRHRADEDNSRRAPCRRAPSAPT